jgi:hypothetical protein
VSLSQSHLRPTRDTPASRLSLGGPREGGLPEKSNPPMHLTARSVLTDASEYGGGEGGEIGNSSTVTFRPLDDFDVTNFGRDLISPLTRATPCPMKTATVFRLGSSGSAAQSSHSSHSPILRQQSGIRISVGTPRNSGSRVCPASGTPYAVRSACTPSDPPSLCARRVAGP